MHLIANAVRYGTAKGEWFLNVVSLKLIGFKTTQRRNTTRLLFYPQEKSLKPVKDLASRLLDLILLSYLLERKGPLGLLLKVHTLTSLKDILANNEWMQATIRLAPVIPTTVAVVQFPNVQKATEAVVDVMNRGVGIRTFQYRRSLLETLFYCSLFLQNASNS